MHVLVVEDYKAMSKKAAVMVLNQLAMNEYSVFGFATGSTPEGLYTEICQQMKKCSYSFRKSHAFNLDEYIGLSADHSKSYAYYMQEKLYSCIDMPKARQHIPNGMAKDVHTECKRYEALLRQHPIDIQILGIGENGHIGFNEPGSTQKSETRVVDLAEVTIEANSRFFKHKEEVPRQAITMGINTILKAKQIVLLASGTKKARALRDAIEGKPDIACPASLLQFHPNVTVIVDKAAASMLHKDYADTKNGWTDVTVYTEQVLPKQKNILVISPHPDDSAVSCGATIAALQKENKVHVAVMTSGYRALIGNLNKQQRKQKRQLETKREMEVLKVAHSFLEMKYYDQQHAAWEDDLEKLDKIWKAVKPDIVLLPHDHDEHPTHSLSTQLVKDYVKRTHSKHIALWHYEGPWSQHMLTTVNTVFGFNHALLQKKNRAIRKHRSQVERTPLVDIMQTLSRFRALSLPEQRFVSYGSEPPNLSEYVEAYYVEEL